MGGSRPTTVAAAFNRPFHRTDEIGLEWSLEYLASAVEHVLRVEDEAFLLMFRETRLEGRPMTAQVRLGRSAMSAQCPVCPKADMALLKAMATRRLSRVSFR
jgi:hypothetical protein